MLQAPSRQPWFYGCHYSSTRFLHEPSPPQSPHLLSFASAHLEVCKNNLFHQCSMTVARLFVPSHFLPTLRVWRTSIGHDRYMVSFYHDPDCIFLKPRCTPPHHERSKRCEMRPFHESLNNYWQITNFLFGIYPIV